MNKQKVLLTILDGFGISEKTEGNAIKLAKKPNYDHILKDYPSTTVRADGLAVGLPEGQMGNSEVGHLNIGAGRVVYQEYTRINKSIEEKDFFSNEKFVNAIEHAKKNNSALHVMGLVSPGGVHSAMNHLYAIIDLAKTHNLKKFYIHAFLDGRDTPPASATEYLKEVEQKLAQEDMPIVASVIGRYYAMDRDNRWERVQQAYDSLTLGEGIKAKISYEGVENSYKEKITDEFVKPIVVLEEGRLKDNDAMIFFNFRPDRAREITKAITASSFNSFDRKKVLKNIYYVCMTQYDETFDLPIAFPPSSPVNLLADICDKYGIKQFRTAETEKYAHVTFFFNGGVEEPHKSETRALVDSPKVPTYDLQPEMSAYKVLEKLIEALNNPEYQLVIVNFANPDMVGHTGILEAAIKAIETIDECLGKIRKEVEKNDFAWIITADHGNAECMIDPITGKPHTAHTTNPVPFILANANKSFGLTEGGKLADISPTVLDLMDIEQPQEMDGKSLINKNLVLNK